VDECKPLALGAAAKAAGQVIETTKAGRCRLTR